MTPCPQCEESGNPAARPHQTRFDPHPSLLRELRTFLSDPNTTFKTPEQAEALEVSINRTEHLLLIGPTAMGKSLVYMLPATSVHYDRNLVTIVILPLSSLHADFQRRCHQLNIPSSRWLPPPSVPSNTSIVYVSPEHTQTSVFPQIRTQPPLHQETCEDCHRRTPHWGRGVTYPVGTL